MKKPLALALDNEIRRVAREEDISLEKLVSEVAKLIGRTTRTVYNYRSSKWDLPSSYIPVLCERFKSRTLLDALTDEVKRMPLEVPQDVEFSQLSIEILRQTCDHHYALIEAYKSPKTIDLNILHHLEERTELLIQQERTLFALLDMAHEQSKAQRRRA